MERWDRNEINYQLISPSLQLNVTHKFADCTSDSFVVNVNMKEGGIHADRSCEIQNREEKRRHGAVPEGENGTAERERESKEK